MPCLDGTAEGFLHRSRVSETGQHPIPPTATVLQEYRRQSLHGGTSPETGLETGRKSRHSHKVEEGEDGASTTLLLSLTSFSCVHPILATK